MADQPGVVNPSFTTNVYDLVGILRECPGPATEVTCSRLRRGQRRRGIHDLLDADKSGTKKIL